MRGSYYCAVTLTSILSHRGRGGIVFLCAFFLFTPTFAYAQVANSDKNKPVEIEASSQLEWLREQNKYRATGDVIITQGGTVITGKSAEASYDPKEGPSALTQITVTDDVTIKSDGRTITADTGTYDTVKEILNLRGDLVTLTAPDLNVTAHDGMDYYATERKAVATGKAEVKQKRQTLRANSITAWFDADNKLQRATATGNVVIIQPSAKGGQDIAQADRGDYDLVKNTAILRGNVKLTQGDNHMQGDVATIDLKTGYSTLQNTNGGTGRVRAIFTSGGGNPSITGSVPMVNAKKEFEPAYATGTRPANEDSN